MTPSEIEAATGLFILFFGFYTIYGGLKDLRESTDRQHAALLRVIALLVEKNGTG